jgi:hypothetical protein
MSNLYNQLTEAAKNLKKVEGSINLALSSLETLDLDEITEKLGNGGAGVRREIDEAITSLQEAKEILE